MQLGHSHSPTMPSILLVLMYNSLQLTIQCHSKDKAPCRMLRGSATSDQRFAYFATNNSYVLYSYEWSTEEWKTLPVCEYRNASPVIINGELTTVGGESFRTTNKLLTLRQGEWVEEYPPMNTARTRPAVVNVSDYIFAIAGGIVIGNTTVELLEVNTRKWYGLTSLPQSLSHPSATVCGNQVHVIGANDKGYSCSLQALTLSYKPIPSQSATDLISWTSLPQLPVRESMAATLCG